MTHSFRCRQIAIAVIAVSWSGLMGLPTNGAIANESSPSTRSAPPPTDAPEPPTGTADRQPKPAAAERSTDPLQEDRVYISDVYPEYCRSYFFRRDWVSLFEYRETMYRCLYGPDRWR